jgi:hypothetical protein
MAEALPWKEPDPAQANVWTIVLPIKDDPPNRPRPKDDR